MMVASDPGQGWPEAEQVGAVTIQIVNDRKLSRSFDLLAKVV